jgi:Predicted transcription factor, homolog of eukaryotic MBF1
VENKNIIELVKKARGDRSLREYAKDAEVNVSILSRIESGEYKPGKKVLEKLTSPNAKPQGGVTYQDLVEAANDNDQYKKGIAAGMTAAGLLTGPIPGVSAALLALAGATVASIKTQQVTSDKGKKQEEKSTDDLQKIATERYATLNREIHRFTATATGLLYGKLAEMGVHFRPGNKDETDIVLYEGDSLLFIEDEVVDTWLLGYIALSEADRGMDMLIKKSTKGMIERWIFTVPDQKRKFSIVVNDGVLFNYLVELKGKNSFRGNLSVIQVDVKNVQVIREEYIAFYDITKPEELLKLTGIGGNLG